jgi:pantothenate kinase
MLGIAGPPGSGKSTLAKKLFEELEQLRPQAAVIVPMDGFHLDNETLKQLNLHHLKGIPDTFDGAGFVALLDEIRQAPLGLETAPISAPTFDRSIESTVPDGMFVRPEHRIVIIEGNYLLLEAGPWGKIKSICDEIWYLDVPEDVLLPRLIERHMAGGKNQKTAEEKVYSTDLPNARLVAQSKKYADKVVSPMGKPNS